MTAPAPTVTTPARAPHFSLLPLLALLLWTAGLSLLALGTLPLLDVDEPVYAQVGREMARGGWAAWLSPHYNGGLWFDKPPLFYWLSALSMRAFGETEFAARLPSALMAVVLVAATVGLCRRLYPAKPAAALWAGFALSTCVQFFLLARAAVTDMTLCGLLTLALWCAWAWLETDKTEWAVGAGACVGLACLCKGPVALVLMGALLLAHLLVTRQGKRLLRPGVWLALLTCFAVALPWYAAMMHLHGQLFVRGFLEANNITRFLTPEHAETQNPLFYALWFPALFLPATPALVASVPPVWARAKAETGQRPTLFCVLWVAIVFVFFSVSQTKLITYIFPLYPCAAVFVGLWLAEQSDRVRSTTATATAVLLALLLAGLVAAGVKFNVPPVTLALWVVILGAGIVWTLTGGTRRWLAPGAAVSLALLTAWTSPAWRTRAADVSDAGVARQASILLPPNAPFYALGLKHPSLVFYSGRRVVFTDDWDAALADMTAHPKHVYAVRTRDWDKNRTARGFSAFRVLAASSKVSLVQGTPVK